MAFDAAGLTPIGGQSSRGRAPQMWAYRTLDAHAVVDSAGYFDDGATTNTGMRNIMNMGDIIFVTTVAGTIAVPTSVTTYGSHVVLSNAAGIIDVSNVTVGVVTDTD